MLLRPMREDDLEDLFEVFNNAEAMRYWSTLPYTDRAQMAAHICEAMALDPATGIELAVEHAGRVIGKAGFWKGPEIGYILHPDHWRRGFGTEIMGALIDHGFQVRGLDHILADVDPDNLGSITLLQRFGFRETGRAKDTIKIGDQWVDSVYFRLEAPT